MHSGISAAAISAASSSDRRGLQADYKFEEFPDREFSGLVLKCVGEKDKKLMLSDMKKLTNYILEKTGGFKIDGWKMRTPVK